MKPKAAKIVPAGKAKTHFLSLIRETREKGTTHIVTNRGQVMAHIVPPPKPSSHSTIPPIYGAGKGYMKIKGDILSPAAPAEEWDVFSE